MRQIVALSVLCISLVRPLAAQDLDNDQNSGGLRFVFDLNTRVEASDNFALATNNPKAAVIATQSLGVAVLSETRRETFAFGLGGVHQTGTVPGTGIGTGWRDPSARLAYSRESISSALEFSTQFRREELGLGRTLPDLEEQEEQTVLPSDLIGDLGRLDRLNANAQLELGRASRLGLTLGATYDLRDYDSTTNPDLYDRRTTDLTSDLRLDLSPSLQMHLLAGLSRHRADDIKATSRDTEQVGARLDARLDATKRLSAGLSHDTIKTGETLAGQRQVTTQRGTSATLEYAEDLPSGEVGVTLASDFSTTGRRNSLTLGRSLDLPRARLKFQLGVVGTTDDPQAIGSVNYALDLPRGGLSARLERNVRTTGDGDEILQTVAHLAHHTQINAVSGLDFTANYARVRGLTNSADDVSRGVISASYNRALTRDWTLSVGLSHTRETAASSNLVFISLGRKATVRW